MNVTKITVGRLYNLGSYEHVRYEIAVEIQEGQSAAVAIRGIEKILTGLAPISKQGIKEPSELRRMAKEVENMKTMPLADWQRHYGHCEGTAEQVIDRYQKALEEESLKTHAAMKRAAMSRELLDQLGGAAVWKDAKLDWEDDYNDDL